MEQGVVVQATMREPVHHYFGGGAAALNMHERMADVLLTVLSLSMETPGTSSKSVAVRDVSQSD